MDDGLLAKGLGKIDFDIPWLKCEIFFVHWKIRFSKMWSNEDDVVLFYFLNLCLILIYGLESTDFDFTFASNLDLGVLFVVYGFDVGKLSLFFHNEIIFGGFELLEIKL